MIRRAVYALCSVIMIGTLFIASWALILRVYTGDAILSPSRSVAAFLGLLVIYAAGPVLTVAGAVWLIRRVLRK